MEELRQKVQDGDLDVKFSFGFVCFGKMRDFISIRSLIETMPEVRLIFQKQSSSKLYLLKEGEMDERRIQKPE